MEQHLTPRDAKAQLSLLILKLSKKIYLEDKMKKYLEMQIGIKRTEG
jgi:hypothetical protein